MGVVQLGVVQLGLVQMGVDPFRYGQSFEHQTKPALLTSDEAEYDGGTKEKLNASALV